MLYKKHRIKPGVLNLIRIRLNLNEDVCDICFGKSCKMISICSEISILENHNYDYKFYSTC